MIYIMVSLLQLEIIGKSRILDNTPWSIQLFCCQSVTFYFRQDVLSVVMGASKEDYDKVLPPKSVIHVDDFDSPKKLAEYLHKLDRNDTLYNDYFRWKGSGHFINTKFMCRLCAMLHDKSRRTWYEDVEKWWRGPDICIKPTAQNIWGSWKKVKRQHSSKFLL